MLVEAGCAVAVLDEDLGFGVLVSVLLLLYLDQFPVLVKLGVFFERP